MIVHDRELFLLVLSAKSLLPQAFVVSVAQFALRAHTRQTLTPALLRSESCERRARRDLHRASAEREKVN